LEYLNVQWIVICSAVIWLLNTPKLQAATENSVALTTFQTEYLLAD
jgi:hypothetical protein